MSLPSLRKNCWIDAVRGGGGGCKIRPYFRYKALGGKTMSGLKIKWLELHIVGLETLYNSRQYAFLDFSPSEFGFRLS